MKKSISILLVLILLLGSIPVYASTQSTDLILVSLIDRTRKDVIIMAKESTFKKTNESLASKLAKVQDLNLREGSDDYFVYQRNKENSTLTKKITDIYPSYFITYSDTTKSKTFSSISDQEFGNNSKDLYLQNSIITNTNDGNRMPVSYLFDYNFKRNPNLGNFVTKDEKDDATRVVSELTNSWTRIKSFVLSSTNKRSLSDQEFSNLLYGLATKKDFKIDTENFTFEIKDGNVTLTNDDVISPIRAKSIEYVDNIPKRTLSSKVHIDENDYISLSMMISFALLNEKGLGINTASFESLDLGVMEKTINKIVSSINSLTNTLLNTDTKLEDMLSENKDGLITLYYQYATVPIIVLSIIVTLVVTLIGKVKNMNANSDVRSYIYSSYQGILTALLIFVSSSIVLSFLYSLNNVLIMVIGLNGVSSIEVNSMNLLVSILFLIIAIPIALIKSIIQVYTLLLPFMLFVILVKYLITTSVGNNNFSDEAKQILGFGIASSVFSLLHGVAVAFVNFLVLKGIIGVILTPIIYLTLVLFIFDQVNKVFNGVFSPVISFLKIFGVNLEVVGSATSAVGRAIQSKVSKGQGQEESSSAPVQYSQPEASTDMNATSNAFDGNAINSFKENSTSADTSKNESKLEPSTLSNKERLNKIFNSPHAKILSGNLGKGLEATGSVLKGAGKATEGTASLLQSGNGLNSISQGARDMAVGSATAAKVALSTPSELFNQHKYDKFLENGATKSFTESGSGELASYELDNGYFNKHGVDVGFDKGYTAKWDNDKLTGNLRDNANYINHYDQTQGTEALMSNFGFSDLTRDSKGKINGFTLKANSDEKDTKGKSLYNNNMERVLGISSIKKDDISNTTTISKKGIYKTSNYEPIPDLRKVQRYDNALYSVLQNTELENINKTGISFNSEKVKEIANEKNINLDELYKEVI